MNRSTLVLAGIVFLAAGARAQTLLYPHVGTASNDRLGVSVASAGDVNQDGRPDYVIGAPQNGNPFVQGNGYARVYSGATGTTLYTLSGSAAADAAGASVAGAGDVNLDGYADVIVGSPGANSNTGKAAVYSGATGLAIYASLSGGAVGDQLGLTVAGIGDVNNDGYDDFLAASAVAPAGGSNRGTARVYSGRFGTVLQTINGTSNNERFGVSADGVGDLNNDGYDEFVIGSLFGGARVYSWNGASYSVLYTFTGVTDDRLGTAVAGAGDVNGDGVPDIVAGAPQDNNVFAPGKGFARIYSGANGSVIRTVVGINDGERFGAAVDGARDLNGDNRAEIIVGAEQSAISLPGYARVFSGIDGSVMATLNGAAAGNVYGFSVAGLGNVNAAGGLEVIVGAPNVSTPQALNGRAEVWTIDAVVTCPTPYNFCVATVNSTGFPASIAAIGSTSVAANTFGVQATNCPPNTLGLFYYGPTEIQQPFGNGNRCVGGQVWRTPVLNANSSGVATRLLDFNSLPLGGQITGGSTWKFQFWFRNSAAGGANFNLSNGVSVTFCN